MSKTILVAEDEEAILKSLVDELTLDGFKVLRAMDGLEALRLALHDHPDMILLDNIMPKMTGIEMLIKLREDEWGKNAPVIFFTNIDTDDKTLNQIMALNPSYYINKQQMAVPDLLEKINNSITKSL